MDLTELRQKIDAIDDQLVALFGERMEVAEKIAEYKRTTTFPFPSLPGSAPSSRMWQKRPSRAWKTTPAFSTPCSLS